MSCTSICVSHNTTPHIQNNLCEVELLSICEDEGCAVPEKTFVVLKRDDKLYKNKQTFLYTEGFEHAYHVPSKTKFQEMIYLSPQF